MAHQKLSDYKREAIIQDLHTHIVKEELPASTAKAIIIFSHLLNVKKSDTSFWRPLLAEAWAMELPGVANK
jgi:hypothetical protein